MWKIEIPPILNRRSRSLHSRITIMHSSKKIGVGNNRKSAEDSCKEDEEDKWVWSRNGYSVKEAYSSILEEYEAENSSELAAVWNGLLPLKVKVWCGE